MRTMTATEASRSFASVLDDIEDGEVVVVTRGGKRVAMITPASVGNGRLVAELVTASGIDVDFGEDIRSTTDLVTDEAPQWPDA